MKRKSPRLQRARELTHSAVIAGFDPAIQQSTFSMDA
jgi:hypothetical protein